MSTSGKRSNFLALVLVASVAAGLLLLTLTGSLGRAWATPEQQPLYQTVPTAAPGQSVTTICPGAAGTLTSPTGDVTVTFPAGCVTQCANVVYTPRTLDTIPPGAAGFRLLGHAFTLEAYVGLTRTPGYTFAAPVTLCITYTDADLAAAGNNPNNLVVQRYNEATGQWESLPTTVDIAARKVCTTITHLSLFVLAAKAALPPTGEPVGSGLVSVALGLAGVGILALGSLYLRRSRRATLR